MKSIQTPHLVLSRNQTLRSRLRERGFTLIEIVVVAAILVILLGLLTWTLGGTATRFVSYITNAATPASVTTPALGTSVDVDGRFTVVPGQILVGQDARFEFTLIAVPRGTALRADGTIPATTPQVPIPGVTVTFILEKTNPTARFRSPAIVTTDPQGRASVKVGAAQEGGTATVIAKVTMQGANGTPVEGSEPTIAVPIVGADGD